MGMRITCMYRTLFVISVVSSALSFLIVASDTIQTHYYSSFKRNETFEIYDNETLNRIEEDTSESSRITVMKFQNPPKVERRNQDHLYDESFNYETTNFETVVNGQAREKENPYKNPDIVAETLTQQPNLSEGISETEHGAVLSFIDTTAAELQSMVEPKIDSELSGAKLFAKNSSLLTKSLNIGQNTQTEPEEILPSTHIPSPSITDEITNKPTEVNVIEEALSVPKSINDKVSEVVVVVRAEQAPVTTEGSDLRLENEVVNILPEDTPKVDGTFTSSVSNDTESKVQVDGGVRDEAAAVALDEGTVPVGSRNPHEDIPSFSEWTQKRLEEAEKKEMHPNASVQNSGAPARRTGGMKVGSKNYASPDCGAKVIASNPEAQSARRVLASTRDEYMLNTCTSRIWFVVELCEAIQAKKIDLANFELFSSSPKDFSVYISDRFPTRDWSPVGQFTAKDIKDVQSFVLQPHLFGKFIKVELHTHYGSEHFCPISLFRAYGTSEFEVLETETENQVLIETNVNVDDEYSDEEDLLDLANGQTPGNLFGSARDAVLSIVKKAAEVLVKSSDLTGNNITKIQQSIDGGSIFENSYVTCTTPRYTILCRNCSDQKFAKIFEIISCREQQLNKLLEINFVNETLRYTKLCEIEGVGIGSFTKKYTEQENAKTKATSEMHNQDDEGFGSTKSFQMAFLTSVFKSEYIAALCNVLAIKERKMVLNMSHEIPSNDSKDIGKEDVLHKDSDYHDYDVAKSFQHSSATCSLSADSSKSVSLKEFEEATNGSIEKVTGIPIGTFLNSENLASKIKPTKTLGKEEVKNDSSIPTMEFSKSGDKETIQSEVLTTAPVHSNIGYHPVIKNSEEPPVVPDTVNENFSQTASLSVSTTDNIEFLNDTVLSDTEPLELSGEQHKADKIERLVQEGLKQAQESLDQEIKQFPQDPLTFDSLLSDLKDLESETAHIQNGPAASVSSMQSTTNTTPQKESVFLRLSNRIKALERNMSLSGQYLEELSRRYKKQVEEMQRSLDRTVSAMGEETRKREERELRRAEEIAVLREEIAILSKSVNNLLYDRDSWRGKFSMICQHVLLICCEVIIIIMILAYCRGNKPPEMKEKNKPKKDVLRRKSAENFSSHVKKSKKRRPSEIASHISGTYRELMIEDKSHETKKEKKKKRRREAIFSNNTAGTNNEAKSNTVLRCTPATDSFTDAISQASDLQKQNYAGLKSDLEIGHNVQLIKSCNENFEVESVKSSAYSSHIEHLNDSNLFSVNTHFNKLVSNHETVVDSLTDILNSENNSDTLRDIQLNATSSFMKTALSTRRKRKASSNDMNGDWNQMLDDSADISARVNPAVTKVFPEEVHHDDETTNGLFMDRNCESRSSSMTSVSKRRDKKSTGLRKMVRKFF